MVNNTIIFNQLHDLIMVAWMLRYIYVGTSNKTTKNAENPLLASSDIDELMVKLDAWNV